MFTGVKQDVLSLCLQKCKGVKQGVYRGETGCFKPMSTGVFTGVKQGVYKGETGCLQG